ncbi:MAG: vitamin K epoxide reductase family protein [Candidatus Tumulicola sp.]
MLPKAIVTLLCGVGLYTSLFMLSKARCAARGRLTEASVVESPRARLFGGVPNALVGTVYYAALGVGIWLVRTPLAAVILLAAVALAALTSLFLAYSLVFITRRPCPYCWSAHAVNWALAILCSWLLGAGVLSSHG